ncbi:MAG: hypothetical protein COX70_04880 [Flavobacteriales bacterium CG_4_10_14_0_2_um_filter_32_8]|nr:MAG: hypothetical protein COX70_04880 [Flavobacteriales bacterium CG_4_10_14_0_2_um_filter_32_8]
MKIGIQAALAILSIFIAYLIWDSVDSKIVLTESVATRNKVVQQKLEQIRDAQVEYKKVRGEYAGTFEQLVDFLENDSIVQVKMEGEVPDSLLGKEAEALRLGIIIRDTIKIPVREELFKENFQSFVDSISYIPFSRGEKFTIAAGELEKGKMKVKVFEVKAPITAVYKGLKTDNEGIDMTLFIAIGSMEEPTTNGNWND